MYRYVPDHKIFDAKTALYIACTNSLVSIMGFNHDVLAYFEGLCIFVVIKRKLKTIEDHRKAFWVSI